MRRIEDITHNGKPLVDILSDHKNWLAGAGGQKANLSGANLSEADLRWSNLSGSNLSGSNLSEADLRWSNLIGSDLSGSNLSGSNLRGSNLRWSNLIGSNLSGSNLSGSNLKGSNLKGSNLRWSNLSEADLSEADLRGSDLLCFGNMRQLRTMQIDTWAIGYTADTLQIGCQHHAIDKWRKWATPAGRKWIQSMDKKALEWADRNLALVLQIIDANPATPTGHEKND